MKPYLDQYGFFEGEIDEEFMSPDFVKPRVDIPAPTELPPAFQGWLFHTDRWVLASDNRGKRWYDPEDIESVFVGDTPTATPPAGYVEFVNGVAPIERPDKALTKAKLRKRDQINLVRDRKETEGYPYLGTWFQSDERAVARISTASLAAFAALTAGVPFNEEWTAADNTQVPLDALAMLGMPVALATHASSLHNTARALKAQVDAATTHDQIEAITWPND